MCVCVCVSVSVCVCVLCVHVGVCVCVLYYDTNTHLIQPPMSKHIEKGVDVRFTGEVEP